MDICKTCKFYKSPLMKSPTCTRISDISLITKKNKPMSIPVAFKICKGYFYEKKRDDDDGFIFEEGGIFWVMCSGDDF